jgi:hypothetical protein
MRVLRPKSGKWRLNLLGTCFGGKINWFGPKNCAKRRRASQLENQESGYGPRYSSPTQGFNLRQITPNWFQGNCRVEPCLKLAYVYTIAVLGVLGSCSTQEAASPSAFVFGLRTRLQQAGYGKKLSCVSLPEPCYGT